jgi:hypothetical protein
MDTRLFTCECRSHCYLRGDFVSGSSLGEENARFVRRHRKQDRRENDEDHYDERDESNPHGSIG